MYVSVIQQIGSVGRNTALWSRSRNTNVLVTLRLVRKLLLQAFVLLLEAKFLTPSFPALDAIVFQLRRQLEELRQTP